MITSWFVNLPVFVQTPKRVTSFLEAQLSYTIGQIKIMIQEAKGVHTDESIVLKVGGRLLEDGHTLSDYNIQSGATVTYVNASSKDQD